MASLLGYRAHIGNVLGEFPLTLVYDGFTRFHGLVEHHFGTAVGRRNERILEIEKERKDKHYRRDDERYRVDKRNTPAELTALCICQVSCQFAFSLNCS